MSASHEERAGSAGRSDGRDPDGGAASRPGVCDGLARARETERSPGARCLGLLVGLVLSLAACQGDELSPRRSATAQTGEGRVADQIIEDGTHVVTREGVKKAEMNARRIYFYNAEAKVEADSVHMTFFDGSGIEQSRLNADHTQLDQRTNDMVARGDVLVVAEDGSRIQGEELRYDATRDLIVSDKPVTIFQGNNRIQGKGVESDPALTNIRLTGTSAVLESKPRVGGERSRSGAGAGRGAERGAAARPAPARPPAAGSVNPAAPGAPPANVSGSTPRMTVQPAGPDASSGATRETVPAPPPAAPPPGAAESPRDSGA